MSVGSNCAVKYFCAIRARSAGVMERNAYLVDAVSSKRCLSRFIKLSELPEDVIPTFVRFERVDAFYSLLPRSLYFSTDLGRHVIRGAFRDTEGNVTGGNLLSLGLPNLGGHKLINQMIEGTSEVLQDVANDKGNVIGNIVNPADIMDRLSRLRVYLSSDSIGLGFAVVEGVEREIQVTDVLIGPFDFLGGLAQGC